MSGWRRLFWRRIVTGHNLSSDAKRESRRQPTRGGLFRVFALGAWCLAAGACASPISSLVRAEADPTLTLPKVLENPSGYLWRKRTWASWNTPARFFES